MVITTPWVLKNTTQPTAMRWHGGSFIVHRIHVCHMYPPEILMSVCYIVMVSTVSFTHLLSLKVRGLLKLWRVDFRISNSTGHMYLILLEDTQKNGRQISFGFTSLLKIELFYFNDNCEYNHFSSLTWPICHKSPCKWGLYPLKLQVQKSTSRSESRRDVLPLDHLLDNFLVSCRSCQMHKDPNAFAFLGHLKTAIGVESRSFYCKSGKQKMQ